MNTETTAAPTRRYCEDCKFCDASKSLIYAKCNNPSAEPLSNDRFVAREFDRAYASTMRATKESCGPDAVWFEAKQVETVKP